MYGGPLSEGQIVGGAHVDLTLWWTADRYQIRLGTTENLSYKLQFLQATLENTEVQHRSGIIDLTFQEDEKVHFLEFR